MKRIAGICILLLLAGTRLGLAQGFVNLDFESANLTGTQPNAVIPASNAFPGWDANSLVGYDFFSTGGTVISIVDSAVPGITPLQGNYSVFLFGGAGGPATLEPV